MKIMDSTEFIQMLDKCILDDMASDIEFNDEIESIELIGESEMIDIDVTGNHLYYANDILTHNSAANSDDADNSAISDSMGTAMTADYMMFLLQNEEMKEKKELICKVTKNRFNGRTDTWKMTVDYENMRFTDDPTSETTIDDITEVLGTGGFETDYGIKVKQQKDEAAYVKKELKDIHSEDMQNLERLDSVKKDPLGGTDLDELYKDLGI